MVLSPMNIIEDRMQNCMKDEQLCDNLATYIKN